MRGRRHSILVRAAARLGLVAALFAGAGLVPAIADYEAGVAALERGDYPTAFRELTVEADKGDARAEYALGVLYRRGLGVSPDIDLAIAWFKRSADQGFAAAQYNLGVIHQMGSGVDVDYAVAADWYRKAAIQGFVVAQFNLAVLYENGWGVDLDPILAFRWYALAADGGDEEALRRAERLAAGMTQQQIEDATREPPTR